MTMLNLDKYYSSEKFEPKVPIEEYSDFEKETLTKYGSWMNALMIGSLQPTTKEQQDFIRMCHGQEHPKGSIQKVWKKYQLDLMHLVAVHMDSLLSSGTFSFYQVASYFRKLAEHGQQASIEWCKAEGFCTFYSENSAPPIDITNTKIPNHTKNELLDSGRAASGGIGTMK